MQFQITTLALSLLLSPILAVPVTNSNDFVARSVAAIRSADIEARQCVGPACNNPACVPTMLVPPETDKGAFCAGLNMDTFEGRMNALWYCC